MRLVDERQHEGLRCTIACATWSVVTTTDSTRRCSSTGFNSRARTSSTWRVLATICLLRYDRTRLTHTQRTPSPKKAHQRHFSNIDEEYEGQLQTHSEDPDWKKGKRTEDERFNTHFRTLCLCLEQVPERYEACQTYPSRPPTCAATAITTAHAEIDLHRLPTLPAQRLLCKRAINNIMYNQTAPAMLLAHRPG